MPQSHPAILPSRYYLDHFDEMITFVATKYDHVLEVPHHQFINTFRSLSIDAQCLYVRFANRKGRAFIRQFLDYEEIGSIPAAVEELLGHGFIRLPRSGDFNELLALRTRTDLISMIKRQVTPGKNDTPRLSSAKKADLVRFIVTRLPFENSFPQQELSDYLVQDKVDEIDFLLFLYFGRKRQGMTTFALRDLGLVKTSHFKEEFGARFETGEIARAAFHYAKILERLESPTPEATSALLEELPGWPILDEIEIEAMRHRAIRQLGRELERFARSEDALKVYTRSDQFPSTERTVRLLMQRGDRSEAEALLLRLIDNPSCDEELLFAEDFYERRFHRKKVGRLTTVLREARVLSLDESGRDRPEATAVRFLEKQGADAAHVENLLWVQLFGLFFWDLLFDPEAAALHNPFELKPLDLNSGAFYRRHQKAIAEKLRSLDHPPAAIEALRKTWDAKAATPNLLVPWHPDLFELVCRLVAAAPPGGLAIILESMAQNFRANRSGFPDLIIFREAHVSFIEIKTEGDQIRRNQLAQIERLKRAGFSVELAKVQWTVDPDQEYVVVDLETTGGNPAWNRITEIGAVRVRGDRVIDEWSSLVNPGRRIPKNIVELTGITDAMVAGAPPFEAVADAFRQFLGEAVFVAHRVKFDHDFLKAEFERIGQDFRGPTLCTVVSSRRHFPGLSSYGLSALCQTFEIPLESHHRALCDARATAELLKRINAKRLALANSHHS